MLLQQFLVAPKLIKSSQELFMLLLFAGVSVVGCLLANEVELSKFGRTAGLLVDLVWGPCAA